MLLSFLKRSMFEYFMWTIWIQVNSNSANSGKFQHFLGAYILMDLWFFPSLVLNFGGCVLYIVACYTPDFTVLLLFKIYNEIIIYNDWTYFLIYYWNVNCTWKTIDIHFSLHNISINFEFLFYIHGLSVCTYQILLHTTLVYINIWFITYNMLLTFSDLLEYMV